MTPLFSGRCACGEVRFQVRGAVRDRCFCHCQSCRRAAGAPLVAWGTVDADHFSVTGTLALIASSENVTRGFCARCGTTLTYQNSLRAPELDFTLVALDDPALLPPERHIWVRDKLPWLKIDDGLPQHLTVAEAP